MSCISCILSLTLHSAFPRVKTFQQHVTAIKQCKSPVKMQSSERQYITIG